MDSPSLVQNLDDKGCSNQGPSQTQLYIAWQLSEQFPAHTMWEWPLYKPSNPEYQLSWPSCCSPTIDGSFSTTSPSAVCLTTTPFPAWILRGLILSRSMASSYLSLCRQGPNQFAVFHLGLQCSAWWNAAISSDIPVLYTVYGRLSRMMCGWSELST